MNELPDSAAEHSRLANQLRQAGRADEALVHFRRAAELAPNDARAQADFAQMLLSLHRHEEAIAPSERAARLQPNNPVLHLIHGDALRRAERFAQAETAYRTALRLQPALAPAHAGLGLLLRAQKRILDALAPLQRAVELDPNNVFFWTYLAEAFVDWEDFPEAVRCWQRALALRPDRFESLLGLGNALRESGRDADAERYLRAALRLKPDSAQAHLGLGLLYEYRGETNEAATAYREAVRCEPTCADAHFRLADLLRDKLPEPDRIAFEAQLGNERLPAKDRILLLFAQAALLEKRSDYRGAAECAKQAHALASRTPRAGGDDPESHRAFVNRLIATTNADFFRRTVGGGHATPRPVFIFGLPRSGTTLVEQILAAHPGVFAGGELSYGWRSFAVIPAALNRTGDAITLLPSLDAPAVRRLAEQHLARLNTLDGGRAARVTDKNPGNYVYLGLLAAMFPNATFIHCRRDLRDVAASCWMTHFHWLEWTHDPNHIVARFRDYVRLMRHWRAVLPVPIHEIVYEELVGNLEAGARKLVSACGLDWDARCLEFHRARRPVRTASTAQVRTPVYTTSVGRWRRYEPELADLFAACEAIQREG